MRACFVNICIYHGTNGLCSSLKGKVPVNNSLYFMENDSTITFHSKSYFHPASSLGEKKKSQKTLSLCRISGVITLPSKSCKLKKGLCEESCYRREHL